MTDKALYCICRTGFGVREEIDEVESIDQQLGCG
jgi:hypothetical protein